MIWFTSDLHFGHELVSGLRGFTTTFEHDNYLMDMWRRQVRPTDQVWVLGDVAMKAEWGLDLIYGLPGTKHLITGNHDRCHPMHKNAHKEQQKYLRAFDSVQAFAYKKIAGQRVLLSHFPYTADHTDEARYEQFRLPDRGSWLLHGHTHSEQKITSGREIHVGLDAWGLQLASLPEIEGIIYQGG